MDPKYTVIASIITAIVFVSAFTYHILGFFLRQDYDKPGPRWKKAKDAFKLYFQFVDDGNTELVINGTFAIVVLLFIAELAHWKQVVWALSCVTLKCLANYRVVVKYLTEDIEDKEDKVSRLKIFVLGELYTNYFGHKKGLRQLVKTKFERCSLWFFFIYLLFLMVLPFSLTPSPPWSRLPSWWAQPIHHVALFVITAHILFWILAAEIWRPGEALALAEGLKFPGIDSWMIRRCHDLAAKEYEKNDRHRDNTAEALINTATEMVKADGTKLNLLYAGCGPGEILQRLNDKATLWYKILAIDFSEEVLSQAKQCFNPSLPSYIEFGKFDFMHIHEYKDTIKPDNFDLIACLNNTLGNVVPRGVELASIDRKECIAEFFRVLRPGGKLFLSVYNVEHLNKDDVLSTPICQCQLKDATKKEGDAKKRLYSDNLILDDDLSDVDKGDLILEPISQDDPEADSHSPHQLYFYSHWFSTGEVRRLLEESGFVDVHVYREGDKTPPQRIIAVGVKGR